MVNSEININSLNLREDVSQVNYINLKLILKNYSI
jgi:hypothetical protein